jgi:hypothetical protein
VRSDGHHQLPCARAVHREARQAQPRHEHARAAARPRHAAQHSLALRVLVPGTGSWIASSWPAHEKAVVEQSLAPPRHHVRHDY